MKIGQPAEMPKVSSTPPAATGAAAAAKTGAGAGAAAAASSSANSASVAVTVSTQVRTLEQAKRAETAAEVDSEKVQAVRTAMEQGTYVVNAEAIADKLLSNAQEMLNRTHN